MAKAKEELLEWYWWVIIILLAIIAILLFIVSIGTVDVTTSKIQPKSKKPSDQEILKKHHRLLEILIQKREEIYRARKRAYRIVYFGIRLIFISIWLAGNFLLYFMFGVNDLGKILDYNNALIVLLIALIFLIWGRFSTLHDWVSLFEKRLEIWIFKKYIRIPELIEDNKSSLEGIKQEISQI